MKKLVLLSSISALALTVFMSNQGGAAANSPGDRTGRAVATTTCRSCHTGSTYGNVTVTQEVKNANGDVVTSYTGGATYTVTLTINKTAGTPVGYSFQWVAVKAADNATQAGNPTTTQAGTVVHTLSTRKYVEQSARLATNIITFTWVAPAAGSGSVKTVFVGMPVNGNNNDGGTDTCSPSTSVTLTEDVVGTERIDAPVSSVKVVPNPVADVLRLQINAVKNTNYTVQVADLNGRIVATENATLTTGDNTVSMDASQLSAGVYIVRLLGANAVEATATMVKK
jgi:Secretion system C-terminal sorting domain/Reeler domain